MLERELRQKLEDGEAPDRLRERARNLRARSLTAAVLTNGERAAMMAFADRFDVAADAPRD